MITIERLNEYGANTQEALTRCMGSEALYLRLVKMLSGDTHFSELEKALQADDLHAAFEAAHALKGVLANLSLTPVLTPISELTELLRSETRMDYGPLMEQARVQMEKLQSLLSE